MHVCHFRRATTTRVVTRRELTVVEYGAYQCSLLRPGASHRGAMRTASPTRCGDLQNLPLVRAPSRRAAAGDRRGQSESRQVLEIHDTIYENQHDLSDAALLGYVEQVGADVDKVKSDIGRRRAASTSPRRI